MRHEHVEHLYRSIGEAVRTAREQAKMGQEELGDRVNRTRTSISNIEAGRQRLPIHALYDIAYVLCADPHALLPRLDLADVPRDLAQKRAVIEKYLERGEGLPNDDETQSQMAVGESQGGSGVGPMQLPPRI